jgi:hypothetical protein
VQNFDKKNVFFLLIFSDFFTLCHTRHVKFAFFWQLSKFKKDNFFVGSVREIELIHKTQKEALCFKNNNTLLLSDEKSSGKGGNLYEFKL